MEYDHIILRPMLLSDLSGLMRLKNDEGWNQTEQDWELMISYPNSISLIAESKKQMLGTVTALNYSDMVAWIGMMLVDKAYRGRGISRLLIQNTIEHLKKCRSIKLDATPVGHPIYSSIGFVDELSISRLTSPSVSEILQENISRHAEPVRPHIIPEIIAYDQTAFGANRKELIHGLYKNSPELAWCIRDGKSLSGFCLGRTGSQCMQVGPVYASSEEGAKALIVAALGQITGVACIIDLHTDKAEVGKWLIRSGFITQRYFKRMYLKRNPHPGKVELQFSIGGPELG